MYVYYTYNEYILHGIKGTVSALYRLRLYTDGRAHGWSMDELLAYSPACAAPRRPARSTPDCSEAPASLRPPLPPHRALSAQRSTDATALGTAPCTGDQPVNARQRRRMRSVGEPFLTVTQLVSSLSVHPPTHTLYTPASAQYGLPGPSLPTVVEPSSGIHWSPRPI